MKAPLVLARLAPGHLRVPFRDTGPGAQVTTAIARLSRDWLAGSDLRRPPALDEEPQPYSATTTRPWSAPLSGSRQQ